MDLELIKSAYDSGEMISYHYLINNIISMINEDNFDMIKKLAAPYGEITKTIIDKCDEYLINGDEQISVANLREKLKELDINYTFTKNEYFDYFSYEEKLYYLSGQSRFDITHYSQMSKHRIYLIPVQKIKELKLKYIAVLDIDIPKEFPFLKDHLGDWFWQLKIRRPKCEERGPPDSYNPAFYNPAFDNIYGLKCYNEDLEKMLPVELINAYRKDPVIKNILRPNKHRLDPYRHENLIKYGLIIHLDVCNRIMKQRKV